MNTHRPLSDWVARLAPQTAAGIGPVNDGRERTDARTLPEFAEEWERLAIGTGDDGRRFLALRHRANGTAVVELDDYGAPLEVSAAGVDLVDRIERTWPSPDLDTGDLGILTGESPELRYFLLHRMIAETAPPPTLFHVLPWDQVDLILSDLTTRLHGGVGGRAPDLGHYFQPAVVGVTGALEQLHVGLDTAQPRVIRAAASALCMGLRAADAARVPAQTLRRLAALLGALGERDPLLWHAASVAVAGLTEPGAGRFVAELTELVLVAGSEELTPETRRLVDNGPLKVDLAVTPGGRFEFLATVDLAAGPGRDEILRGYVVPVMPVEVTFRRKTRRYWSPLQARRRWMTASLRLRLPGDQFTVDADLPPVGAAELARVSAAELLDSIRAADHGGVVAWRLLAEDTGPHHPIREALRMFDEETR